MPSTSDRTPLRRVLGTSALVLGLMLSLHPAAGAPAAGAGGETSAAPQGPAQDRRPGAPAAGVPAAGVPAAGAPADRVYVVDGATIGWDLESRRFHSPTAPQAARLAAQLRRWLDAKAATGDGPLAATDVAIETLPDGTKKARLPFWLMNAAAVRLAPGSEPVGLCAEGPPQAHAALSAPAAVVEEK